MEYFQGFATLQLCDQVQEFMFTVGDPDQFQGRIIFMSMFNDDQECNAYADFVSMFAERLVILRVPPTKQDREENGAVPPN